MMDKRLDTRRLLQMWQACLLSAAPEWMQLNARNFPADRRCNQRRFRKRAAWQRSNGRRER